MQEEAESPQQTKCRRYRYQARPKQPLLEKLSLWVLQKSASELLFHEMILLVLEDSIKK